MSSYFELVGWRWVVENCILFKMILGWKLFDKVWRSYAWSKFCWLFLRNPNLATFGFWWIWGHSLRNNDQPLIKWRISLQNVEVGQQSWSLAVYGPQLTFDLIQLIFRHLSSWLGKLLVQGMKLGMDDLEDMKLGMDDLEDILGQWRPFWTLGTQPSWFKMKP